MQVRSHHRPASSLGSSRCVDTYKRDHLQHRRRPRSARDICTQGNAQRSGKRRSLPHIRPLHPPWKRKVREGHEQARINIPGRCYDSPPQFACFHSPYSCLVQAGGRRCLVWWNIRLLGHREPRVPRSAHQRHVADQPEIRDALPRWDCKSAPRAC